MDPRDATHPRETSAPDSATEPAPAPAGSPIDAAARPADASGGDSDPAVAPATAAAARSLDHGRWRYPADARLLTEILASDAVKRRLESPAYEIARQTSRTGMLAGAVMVDPTVLPHLAEAIDGVRREFPDIQRIDCFVYNSGDMNAFITPGRSGTFIALSSAAVNHLDAGELKYVLGHEFGHALFGHIDVLAGNLAVDPLLPTADAGRVRSWQRAAEITADRMGLAVCGSLTSAARALFKVASGIVSDAVVASPERFAAQWQRLVEEVISEGDRGFDHISHPFPPLRMRAMLLFSEARAAGDGAALDAANTAIDGMLAMMEPGGGGGTLDDPLLRGLFFWGGLVVALADGYVSPREWRRLETVAPPGTDLTATVASAAADDAGCWEQFSTAFLGRRRKFSGLELHRVLYGLYDVAKADGKVSDGEMERMRKLAAILGVVPEACDHVAAQFERDLRKTEQVSDGR
ncbi:MAG: hypothetical protein FJ309_15265 [Planctomycetes bacterium]|nr:hypothetical protein [Planctomycetota bacterium]